MAESSGYEVVVGLEVHAQLQTASKLFCGDDASFGAEPNTHISPITMAHPGTLPVLNKKAVEYAIKMGLACNSTITRKNYFARKNYFYPDLPKGYQISQHTTPICDGGWVDIASGEQTRRIRLNRIHLEEDAGKSLHDADPSFTCVDLNRAGVPLIEIVTEPDIRSGEEAFAYLTEIRKRLRYLGICDGNMEEGSMRCDANISIRKTGDTRLGTKVEVKNLNSIRNVKRAIEYEASRLIGLVESGTAIQQQTRSFDAGNGTTFALRTKEEANDYRYFTDPDLTPFEVSEALLEQLTQTQPELPEAKAERFRKDLGLSAYDAANLTDDRDFAHYFELLLEPFQAKEQVPLFAKAAANWMLGPIRSYLNENSISISAFPLTPALLANLIELVEQQVVNFSTASSRLLPELILHPEATPLETAKKLNLIQDKDAATNA
jgi:aspartyl-tRNA(Asn)/glutamyl-tRNA(Gln) amidotransferase subunit B